MLRVGRGWIYPVLFALCFVLVTLPQMRKSYRAAEGLPYSWSMTKSWLTSAECAKQTGKFLVVCPDGRIVPIATGYVEKETGYTVGGADDLGHALALEIYSAATHRSAVLQQVSTLNTTINFAGLILLAILLTTMGQPISSMLLLTAGTLVANQMHGLAPHPAQFGVACLAAILPISILGVFRFRPYWIVLGFITLAMALLFRESIGKMGVVAALAAICWRMFRTKSVAPQLVLMFATIAIAATPYLLLRARDIAYQLPPAERLESHGAWHSLYIGLGAAPNSFGIKWEDANAFEAVKAVDPSVGYVSPEYYEILKRKYFEIIFKHPAEVFRIYVQKLFSALDQKTVRLPIPLWLLLGLTAALGFRARLRANSSDASANFDAVVIPSITFIATFLAQAVLIHFDMQYLFPIQLFPLLMIGSSLDLILRRVSPLWRLQTSSVA